MSMAPSPPCGPNPVGRAQLRSHTISKRGVMRPSGLFLLAAISVALAVAAPASTRPHYGGTLRLSVHEAPVSLDPSDSAQPGMFASPTLSRLIFDTLVTLDGRGQAQPALATAWRAEPGNQRWQFSIRRGATFHDGTALSSDTVAASLRAANPKWKVFATGRRRGGGM